MQIETLVLLCAGLGLLAVVARKATPVRVKVDVSVGRK